MAKDEGHDKATVGGRPEHPDILGKALPENGRGAKVKGQREEDGPGEERHQKGNSWRNQEDRHGGMHGRIDGERHESVKKYEGTGEGYEHTSKDR